jgi:hypothetical protein
MSGYIFASQPLGIIGALYKIGSEDAGNGGPMGIELQCSDGYEFDKGFRAQLPALEAMMIAHDLDPSAFTMMKGPNSSYRAYRGVGRYNNYTIDTGEDSFTVTYANDAEFLEYFIGACVAPDDAASEASPSQGQRHFSLLTRLAR